MAIELVKNKMRVIYVEPQDVFEASEVIDTPEFLQVYGTPSGITTRFDDELWVLSREGIQNLFKSNNKRIEEQARRIDELERAIKTMREIGSEAL